MCVCVCVGMCVCVLIHVVCILTLISGISANTFSKLLSVTAPADTPAAILATLDGLDGTRDVLLLLPMERVEPWVRALVLLPHELMLALSSSTSYNYNYRDTTGNLHS